MTNLSARWDVFVSHASEDKQDFVEPLAKELAAFGVSVWYDQFVLQLGDSLSRSIDIGLAQSNFGLVIISPAFIAKGWTEYELRGLNAREVGSGKVILPIWHNIDREGVLQFSPSLADKFAFVTSQRPLTEIAVKIVEVVRPDIFNQLQRKAAIAAMRAKSVPSVVNLNSLQLGPIRHKSFPASFVIRTKLLQQILNEYFDSPLEEWLSNFARDLNPEDELLWWERFALVFFCSLKKLRIDEAEDAKRHFDVVFAFAMGGYASKADQIEDSRKTNRMTAIEEASMKSLGHWQFSG